MKSKMIPGRSAGFSNFRLGRFDKSHLPIFVHSKVLDQILNDSAQGAHLERGGFLIGNVFEDERSYVEIQGFIPAEGTRSRLTSLSFTHETWAHLNSTLEEKFPGDVVVGWQHTHPGFGVFLSGHDLFIHRNFFSEPWQVAMVVDPRKQELCFFQWVDGRVVDCGFICVNSDRKK